MKKIFFVVCLLWSMIIQAQPTAITGYNYIPENRYQRLFVARGFNLPTGTTPALYSGQWVGFGGMFADSTGGNKGIHYFNGTSWVRLVDTTYTGFSKTLQQVMTAGSTLTASGTNTIDVNSGTLNINNANILNLGAKGGDIETRIERTGVAADYARIYHFINSSIPEIDFELVRSSSNIISQVKFTPDSLSFLPYRGRITIDSLRNGLIDTTTYKPVAWSQANGNMVAMNSWAQVSGGGGSSSLLTTVGIGRTYDSINAIQSNTWALPDTAYLMGHSFFALGTGATSYNLSIGPLGAADYGLPYVAIAQSGAGVLIENQLFGPRRQPGGRGMVLMFGYDNDIRLDPGGRLMYNKIVQGTLAAFANANLKSFVMAGGASVTRSGTWTTGVNANTYGGKTTNGATTTTANDSLVYSFSGEKTACIGLVVYDSVHLAGARGTIIIYNSVDPTDIAVNTTFGTNQRTNGVSDGTNTNQRSCGALLFTGLNPSKSYKLKIISNQSTNTLFIDYVGHLVDPSYAYPFITFDAVKMTAAGYVSFGGSDANINAANVVIDSIATALSGLGYPVYSVPSNTYYTPGTDASGDGFHPSNTGYAHLSTALLATFASLNIPSNGSLHNNGGSLWTSVNRKSLQVGATPGPGITPIQNIWGNDVITGYPGGRTWQFGKYSLDGGQITSNPLHDGVMTLGQTNALSVNESTGYVGVNDNTPDYQFTLRGAAATSAYLGVSANASGTPDMLTYLSSDLTTYRYRVSNAGGAQIMGDLTARVSVNSLEMYVNGGNAVIGGYNGSSFIPFRIYGAPLKFENGGGVTSANMTSGKFFFGGSTSATALVHIAAGTATANTAPLKFSSGTNLTTPEAGAVEFDGVNLLFTPTGTIRKTIPTNIVSRSAAQTAAVATVATQTVGAADASYIISANVLVTTSTVHSFTVTCTYTDEGNTSRTITLTFSNLAGTLVTAIANAAGAVPYEGVPLHIRAKAATTITIATTGTFTTVTYNVEGNISQIN